MPLQQDYDQFFVGRSAELQAFKEFLSSSQGEAALVIGHSGMGKTLLVNRITELSQMHPDLKCGSVRYEILETDSVESKLAQMMGDILQAADLSRPFFSGTAEQWKAIRATLKIDDLFLSLFKEDRRPAREVFLDALKCISERMEPNGRAIFILDPEKMMDPKSHETWAYLVRRLPEKIKFVFAQRPEDALASSHTFRNLPNVRLIPESELGSLSERAIRELIAHHHREGDADTETIFVAMRRYEGHPYSIQAALLGLREKKWTLDTLPASTNRVPLEQWDIIARADGAVDLFEAYAVLDAAVPENIILKIADLDHPQYMKLLADRFIGPMLRAETDGKRIYHAILADFIKGNIPDDRKNEFHDRAIALYRAMIGREGIPDEFAAERLPEHIHARQGEVAFIECVIHEVGQILLRLGRFDAFINLSERALAVVGPGSAEGAMLYGNLGIVYRRRGDLEKAVEHFQKSLAINEALGIKKGMAAIYGNLGNVYLTRGDLVQAEEHYKKSLAIHEALESKVGMANVYVNLGTVYGKHGDLEKAEEHYKKSLELSNALGNEEGMGDAYMGLGIMYEKHRQLDKAEEYYKKGLAIYETLGSKAGMANQYGNLGNVYQARGTPEKAEKHYMKALAINEALGSKEGMAIQCGNLGALAWTRGDFVTARDHWTKSLDLYRQIGARPMIEKVQGLLDGLPKK